MICVTTKKKFMQKILLSLLLIVTGLMSCAQKVKSKKIFKLNVVAQT